MPARLDHAASLNRDSLQTAPGFARRPDGARRAIFQSARVVGMRVRQHDGVRAQARELTSPIQAAIDQDTPASVNNNQAAVPPMATRPGLNLATRPRKEQSHLLW
jgi:hypothetical protein